MSEPEGLEVASLREQLAAQLEQIRTRADERDAAQADNDRLRALIKAHLIEHCDTDAHGDGRDPSACFDVCRACAAYYAPTIERIAAFPAGHVASTPRRHADDCPAFTVGGEVR